MLFRKSILSLSLLTFSTTFVVGPSYAYADTRAEKDIEKIAALGVQAIDQLLTQKVYAVANPERLFFDHLTRAVDRAREEFDSASGVEIESALDPELALLSRAEISASVQSTVSELRLGIARGLSTIKSANPGANPVELFLQQSKQKLLNRSLYTDSILSVGFAPLAALLLHLIFPATSMLILAGLSVVGIFAMIHLVRWAYDSFEIELRERRIKEIQNPEKQKALAKTLTVTDLIATHTTDILLINEVLNNVGKQALQVYAACHGLSGGERATKMASFLKDLDAVSAQAQALTRYIADVWLRSMFAPSGGSSAQNAIAFNDREQLFDKGIAVIREKITRGDCDQDPSTFFSTTEVKN